MFSDSADPIEQFLTLLENSRVKAFFEKMIDTAVEKRLESQKFKTAVEQVLLTSEIHPIQRISALEATTGLDDYGLDEEHEPTIPEKIATIEKQLEGYTPRPTVSHVETKIPETKTELRAVCVVEELRASPKDFLTANDIMDILREKLPDSCKIDETVKNLRKVKQDVVNMAVSMFSDVKTNKKSVGRREVRLILSN